MTLLSITGNVYRVYECNKELGIRKVAAVSSPTPLTAEFVEYMCKNPEKVMRGEY